VEELALDRPARRMGSGFSAEHPMKTSEQLALPEREKHSQSR
jgi:hypothetical protein